MALRRRGRKLAIGCALLLVGLLPATSRGQGGPPMITDDPGTPGNGKWENNIAIAFEHRGGETSYDVPGIDLNYGLGEHIQLTLQTAPVLLKHPNRGPIFGLGGTEAAVKWRFLDEESSGCDMSMFPRIIFNVLQSSVRRGLAERGTRFQLPFQLAKKLGVFDLDFEAGPLVSSVGRSEWLYGVVGGWNLSKKTELMAELHGTSRINASQDILTANFGLRHEFTPNYILITSLGHELRTAEDDPRAFIGYFGMQFVY